AHSIVTRHIDRKGATSAVIEKVAVALGMGAVVVAAANSLNIAKCRAATAVNRTIGAHATHTGTAGQANISAGVEFFIAADTSSKPDIAIGVQAFKCGAAADGNGVCGINNIDTA